MAPKMSKWTKGPSVHSLFFMIDCRFNANDQYIWIDAKNWGYYLRLPSALITNWSNVLILTSGISKNKIRFAQAGLHWNCISLLELHLHLGTPKFPNFLGMLLCGLALLADIMIRVYVHKFLFSVLDILHYLFSHQLCHKKFSHLYCSAE